MKLYKHIAYLLCMALPMMVAATEFHVSPKGNDANPGTVDKPLRTIQAALNKLNPGDVCVVHNGTYRESIEMPKSGYEGAPITIKAAQGEHPIISGLDVLDLKWQATDKKGIYVADYKNSNFEQLFIDGKPMLEARWPNVPRDKNGDWDFFSPNVWSTVDSIGNSYGTIKDKHLAATGWNVTGATAVLNVCHQFFTWTRNVEGHVAGSDSFNYPKDLGKSIKPKDESGASLVFNDDRYYLVGKKEFLDAPGEWYYDSDKQQLYVCMPVGISPEKEQLEVKTRYFSLTASANKNYLIIDGITFFGTAFKFGKDYNSRSNHILFSNNQVLYSSFTDNFSLDASDKKAKLDRNFPVISADYASIINNTFAYGTLNGLLVNGKNAFIENNTFHDFDYNSSLTCPMLEVNKSWPGYVDKGGEAVIRYNTLYNSGGIIMQVAQNDNNVYLNDCYNAFRAAWGGNKDASALYTQNVFCHGTRMHHNWVHDSYSGTPPLPWGGGMGIRGDDKTAGLTIDHNVIWNIGSTGVELKTPDNPTPDQVNKVFNNTVFKHSMYNPVKSGMIIQTIENQNEYSFVINNLSESIYGHWFAKPIGKYAEYSNNDTGEVVESLLESTTLIDFRPKKTALRVLDKGKVIDGFTTTTIGSSPDIGAYERGDSVYWIPGRREVKATYPIVADGSTVSADRDVLMWRPAYNALGHNVYFGTDKANLKLKGGFLDENNVLKLPKLVASKQYFWRVDAVMKDMSVVKGDVWSFTTK